MPVSIPCKRNGIGDKQKSDYPFAPVPPEQRSNNNPGGLQHTGMRKAKRPRKSVIRTGQSELLEAVWRHTTSGLVVYDLNGNVLCANPAARKMAQIAPEGSLPSHNGQVWGHLFNPANRLVGAEELPSMQALRGRSTTEQFRLLEQRGDVSHVLFSASPLSIPQQPTIGAIATLTDITGAAQAGLAATHDAVWAEQRRMAADLHDVLCQDLNAIVLQLRMAEEHFTRDSEMAQGYLRRAHDLAREVLAEARRTMWSFTHEAVDTGDPAIALAQRAKQLFADTPVKLALSLEEEPKSVPGHLRAELYRIGKEALSNVHKHAHASKVHLHLAYGPNQVQLEVEDDGRGFAGTGVPTVDHGYGLVSMRKRVERMGGQLLINTQLKRGTKLTAVVPFEPPLHACT